MSLLRKAPNLGSPPDKYEREFFSRLLRTLTQYFVNLDNPGPIQVTTINSSYFDGTNFNLGLVPTNTLNGAILTGATTITLNDTTGFASSGNAYILDGAISDKIQYTGKTITDLTGVTGVANGHDSGKLVVASSKTGEIFADSTVENTLKIIP